MMQSAFISYASSDRALAQRVRDVLRRQSGLRVWSDEQINPGGEWEDALRRRIHESDVFVLLLTPRALGSQWLLTELGAAWAAGKRIVTVLSDPALLDRLPIDLSRYRYVTLENLDALSDAVQDPQHSAA